MSLVRNILLNPGPATTTQSVKNAQVIPDICPREKEFCAVVNNVRNILLNISSLDYTKYTSILLGCSGTGAIESVLSSVEKPQAKILILINGAYGERAVEICRCYYREQDIEILRWSPKQKIDVAQVEDKLKETSFDYIFAVHHETTSGILNDLGSLCAVAKKYNVQTIVDAMSSFAGLCIDIDGLGIDYLISSSNKCIQGMAGIGIVIAKQSSLRKIKDFSGRHGLYLDLYKQWENLGLSGQSRFTPPVQTVYALQQALIECEEETILVREKRYLALYEEMLLGMKELGFSCYVSEEFHSGILTTFNYHASFESFSLENFHDFLYSYGITIYPGKISNEETFRIANIGDLTSDDIKFFLSKTKEFLNSLK